MLETIPNEEEMTALRGKSLYGLWNKLCARIDEKYDMDCFWNNGGKEEWLKFEAEREHYSKEIQNRYDEAQTYHDGKWIMFEPVDTSLFDDFIRLLRIKRKPNRT